MRYERDLLDDAAKIKMLDKLSQYHRQIDIAHNFVQEYCRKSDFSRLTTQNDLLMLSRLAKRTSQHNVFDPILYETSEIESRRLSPVMFRLQTSVCLTNSTDNYDDSHIDLPFIDITK